MQNKIYKIEFKFEKFDKNGLKMESELTNATPEMLRMAIERLVTEINDIGILKRLLIKFIDGIL